MVLEQVLGGCRTCVLGQGDPVFYEQLFLDQRNLGQSKGRERGRRAWKAVLNPQVIGGVS